MKLNWQEINIPGCFVCKLDIFVDNRGSFQKIFNSKDFAKVIPNFLPRESYITSSAKEVLRGLHFQLPPDDHDKVVICLGGAALDVIVDLRAGQNYGNVESIELTPDYVNCVVMPKGVGHGFYSHMDNTKLLYIVGTTYAPQTDSGILWSSINFEWPSSSPILSDRDKQHPSFNEFIPPDVWRN